MASSAPSWVMVTPDDRGPAINVVAWITMVAMILAVLTKLGSKIERSRQLMSDDLLASLAMIFAVGQTIAVTLGVQHGLGQRQHNLDSHQIILVERAQYASELLYIIAITFSKLVTIRFISMLAPFTHVLKYTTGTYIFTVVWALGAVFGVAFQCPTPDAWAVFSAKCFDQTAFWITIGSLDILIEVVLIVLPVYVLKPIEMDKVSKLSVIIAFVSRFLAVPVIITRLFYIQEAQHSSDRTFDEYGAVMSTQVHVNLVIVLCCFPFLKTFIDSLQSGYLTSDLTTAPSAFFSHHASKDRSITNPFSNASRDRNSFLGLGGRCSRQRSASARHINESCASNTSMTEMDRVGHHIDVETTVTIRYEDNNFPGQRTDRIMSYEEGITNQLTGWH